MTDAPRWLDPFTPKGQREVVAKVLTGMNYRLPFEGVTRSKLIAAYAELAKIASQHPEDDDEWRVAIHGLIADPKKGPLREWLLGLTRKTAQNLGIRMADYPSVFEQVMRELQTWPGMEPRETALLLWCGAATLTIRGSAKASAGKALELSLARAALNVLGLTEDIDYWLNIDADEEVDRQTDAEIATPRGRVRMEVGLIGKGNPEVIGDKIERMDRNGIVVFDILPAKSAMWGTAERRGVKLIQLRNNNPVEELRAHLVSLNIAITNRQFTPDEVEQAVLEMSLAHFQVRTNTKGAADT